MIAFGLKLILPAMHAIPLAILVLGTYGVLYFVFGAGLGIGEARADPEKIHLRSRAAAQVVVDRIYKIFQD